MMLTAFPYPQHRKRCLEAGADFIFDKTSEFQRVPEVLAQLKTYGHRVPSHHATRPRRHSTQPLVAHAPLSRASALLKRRWTTLRRNMPLSSSQN
jgi:hypothetical protein